jgi:hypothetical protein
MELPHTDKPTTFDTAIVSLFLFEVPYPSLSVMLRQVLPSELTWQPPSSGVGFAVAVCP